MTDEAFTERQRAHAQQFQTQLQALYAHLPDPQYSVSPTLAECLLRTLVALAQLHTALPDPVNQGKVLAALHILRSIATDVSQEGRR